MTKTRSSRSRYISRVRSVNHSLLMPRGVGTDLDRELFDLLKSGIVNYEATVVEPRIPGIDWYDRKGKPLKDAYEADALLRDYNYKRVARTVIFDVADPTKVYNISTVWLGLDHGYFGTRPLIFETMVFINESSMDEDMDRYWTEAEAITGHKRFVYEYTQKLNDPVVLDVVEGVADEPG